MISPIPIDLRTHYVNTVQGASKNAHVFNHRWPESHFIFGNNMSLCGLYKCHCFSANIAEFRVH